MDLSDLLLTRDTFEATRNGYLQPQEGPRLGNVAPPYLPLTFGMRLVMPFEDEEYFEDEILHFFPWTYCPWVFSVDSSALPDLPARIYIKPPLTPKLHKLHL